MGDSLLQRDLDIKAAVLSAYEQGKMLAVLSFVRMLLDPVMDSRIFKPPNPWVMGICSLLASAGRGCSALAAGLLSNAATAGHAGHVSLDLEPPQPLCIH